jgi:hypothetical protein
LSELDDAVRQQIRMGPFEMTEAIMGTATRMLAHTPRAPVVLRHLYDRSSPLSLGNRRFLGGEAVDE